MRTNIKTNNGSRSLVMFALAAGLGVASLPAFAQTFTTLHSFDTIVNNTNSDGGLSYSALVQSGNTLYGTTYSGGPFAKGIFAGSIFAINTDGTGFTNLHSFSALNGGFRTNADGAAPYAGLILSGNTLYGTASEGGVGKNHALTVGFGTIYAINTDGSGFTNLHNFSINDGTQPSASLVLSSNRLYGTCATGGSNGFGTIFAVNTDGSGYTVLHTLQTGEGVQPMGGLVLSDTNLFGTTLGGGTVGAGTIFRLSTDGTGFTNLHSFTALVSKTNSDGARPMNTLTLSDNTLYGVTLSGGATGNGALFAINTDGTGFTNFHNFTALNNLSNVDGAAPFGNLFLSGNTLFGTTTAGGSGTNGTVFAVNTDGTDFTVLYNFSQGNTNSDGAAPMSGILSGNALFGLSHFGGTGGSGTVFSLFFP
jgi:uncharacterized repeat protein (TIGR03803 family)